MTQAVWQSPQLPISTNTTVTPDASPIGSGNRFQVDLLQYLLKYDGRLRKLTDQLAYYDFSNVRAAFIGSVPSRQPVNKVNPSSQTSFGWLGLQEILSTVPTNAHEISKKRPHIVMQVSSIATLGAVPTWLSHFQSVLARSRAPNHSLMKAEPKFDIIFPTPEEVRTSLDGYASGGSIHMRVQSGQQQKQLQYLHPLLCHWKHQPSLSPPSSGKARQEAHRGPAAPHIKTYVRFSSDTHESIDWALVTSANLSKQAWGDTINKQGEVRIQSYETGVLVWPDLFADPHTDCDVTMVPTFGKDMPDAEDAPSQPSRSCEVPTGAQDAGDAQDDVETEDEDDSEEEETETEDEAEADNPASDDIETEDESEPVKHDDHIPSTDKDQAPQRRTSSRKRIVVGFRMPYDLPLSPYSAEDLPWCATQSYTEPDWKGRAWGGY